MSVCVFVKRWCHRRRMRRLDGSLVVLKIKKLRCCERRRRRHTDTFVGCAGEILLLEGISSSINEKNEMKNSREFVHLKGTSSHYSNLHSMIFLIMPFFRFFSPLVIKNASPSHSAFWDEISYAQFFFLGVKQT